ncbi:MAG: hypothetical protein A49_22740 [Methyloceanibacter sp.]|nr:MAG: hypothetical protein A49_22740 [Methyloceanibacter sp.]
MLTSTYLATLVLTLAMTMPSSAADLDWDGSASVDWFDFNNWVQATVPTNADNARIDTVSSNPTVVDGAAAQALGVSVGRDNTGMLTIQNGGTVTAINASGLGRNAGSNGTMTINGSTSSFTTGDTFNVGLSGAGTLTIENGGSLSSTGGVIASQANSSGTVVVDGSGSSWTGPGQFYVGNRGNGTLTIQNGGLVSSQFGFVGTTTTGTGNATVSGSGSMWNVSRHLFVGSSGVATLTVRDGGTVTIGDQLVVARQPTSTGTLNIGAAAGQPAAAPGTVNASGLQFGAGNGSLVFNHTGTNYSFAPTISGGGSVNVEAGTTILTANNTYTGPTNVNGGTLLVNGSIVSDVSVGSGGTLGGTGQVGALDVFNKGVYAPGNSIGTQTVNGNFTLHKGAVYEVEVNAAGQGDKAIVKGTVNLTGATLRVLAANGNYKPKTHYTIIDNDGSDAVNGKFSKISENLAFLTPVVHYAAGDGNDVVLTLLKDHELCSAATTDNHCSVANALDKHALDHPLYLHVLHQSLAGAQQAFDALSGEVHATVAGTLVDDSRYVREAVLGRMMQASHQGEALAAGGPRIATYNASPMMLGDAEPLYDGKSLLEPAAAAPLAFWTRAFGAWGDFEGDRHAASADRDLGGFISGMDANVGGTWRVGLATGASFSNVSIDDRHSGADVDSYHLGGYVGGMAGPVALRGGGIWAWNEIETSRAVVFPGFYERQKANYDADTGQLFGEVAYPTQMGGVALEPFAGLAFVSVDTDGFRERGGPHASLRGVDIDQDVGYTTIGLRAAKTMMWGATQVTPHISAAWLHAFDDVTPAASLAFASSGIGFDITGAPLAEDSALLDAGLDFAVTDRITAGVSYSGQFADNVTDNAVKGRFTWLFN